MGFLTAIQVGCKSCRKQTKLINKYTIRRHDTPSLENDFLISSYLLLDIFFEGISCVHPMAGGTLLEPCPKDLYLGHPRTTKNTFDNVPISPSSPWTYSGCILCCYVMLLFNCSVLLFVLLHSIKILSGLYSHDFCLPSEVAITWLIQGMNFLELAKRSYYVGYTEFTTTCVTDSVQKLFHVIPHRGQHVVPPDREQLCDSGRFQCFDVFHFFQSFDLWPRRLASQGGDPTGTGRGGESIYGSTFEDEIHPGEPLSFQAWNALQTSWQEIIQIRICYSTTHFLRP